MVELVRQVERRDIFQASPNADETPPAATDSAPPRVTIKALPPCTRWLFRLSEADVHRATPLVGFNLVQPINSATFGEGTARHKISMRLGPDEWLLIAPADDHEVDFTAPFDQAEGGLAAKAPQRTITRVDISHRHAAISLAGAHATDVLNTACPRDLGQTAFPPGSATRTIFAKAEIILIRLPDEDDQPRYRLECGRSYGRYLHAHLCQSASLLGS